MMFNVRKVLFITRVMSGGSDQPGGLQSYQGFTLSVSLYNEPAHDKIYHKTCVTSQDLDQPVYPSSMARVSFIPLWITWGL